MLSAELLVRIHLLAMASYFGLQIGLIYMLLPAAGKAPDEQSRRAVLIAGFKFYNPFSVAALGATVITGAIRQAKRALVLTARALRRARFRSRRLAANRLRPRAVVPVGACP